MRRYLRAVPFTCLYLDYNSFFQIIKLCLRAKLSVRNYGRITHVITCVLRTYYARNNYSNYGAVTT